MERVLVRVGSLGVIAASFVLAATPGAVVLSFFARVVVVAVSLLFLLVVAYRGWRGELPTRLSERGAEWEPIAGESVALRRELDEMRLELDDLKAHVSNLRTLIEVR